MPVKVEAAVITQKGTAAQFNSDSININKKVLPREVAANGYKGAGIVSGKSFFALACADVESCADAAVVSLNERSEQFLASSADVQDIFSDFYMDITGALTEMGHNSSAFSCALFYADEKSVVISQTGSVKCFRYSEEKLYFVDPILSDHADALSQYGCCRFEDVKNGDLFFLMDANVADSLNNELLESIANKCAGNTKVAVKLLMSKVDSALNAGAFVLKILKDEEEIIAPALNVAQAEETAVVPSTVTEDEETVENTETVKKKSVGSKVAAVAVAAMLVVVFFVVGVFIGRYLKTVIGPIEDILAIAEETSENTDETTTEAEESTEETTEDESSADETTAEAESTTQEENASVQDTPAETTAVAAESTTLAASTDSSDVEQDSLIG